MKLIKMQCPNCGAMFTVTEDSETAVCEYCGTTVAVPRKSAEVTVVHHRKKINYKALAAFGVIAVVLIIAAIAVVLTVGKSDKTDSRAYKAAGVYLVGKDIPAGEYVLYPNVSKKDGDVTPVLEVRKTRESATNISDFLYRKEFHMRQYVNLNDGEYIAFEYALMYLPENIKLKPLDENGYSAAQLKVGVDIPAGEYVIVGQNKQTQYFRTRKPEAELYSTSALNSPDMISFGYAENRVYLRVNDGEYLTFAGGRLYRVGDAPKPLVGENGALPPGQYRVGKEIQSGKYTVYPAENKESQAWVCINKNSVKTGSLTKFDTDVASGGETLLFVRLSEYEGAVEIDIPNSDGEDIYVTLWYCFAIEI
ncbi:MAG: TFIIB-type zinc ribbon-containing protein [Clostridia bacterium]|nr:TFIIB-type zinc ribbon-containing protein [Clostridia bacterium]